MNRYIVVSEEAGNTLSSKGSQNRGPEPASPTSTVSNIDRGEPRKCPSCQKLHHGASQLGTLCCECEHDKIQSGELDLPTKPQYSQERETW